MRQVQPELLERLAADYAIGTLRGPSRRRLERMALTEPAIAEAIARWEARLNTLVESLPPVDPPARVFAAIELEIAKDIQRIDGTVVPMKRRAARSAQQVPVFWRNFAVASAAIAAMLAVYIAVEPPRPVTYFPPIAVLNDAAGHAAFVASVGRDLRDLSITQVAGDRAALNRIYQLWLLPKGGRPRSVGLVTSSTVSFRLPAEERAIVNSGNGIAISLEPPGGSPTGEPTGPVLFTGAIVINQ